MCRRGNISGGFWSSGRCFHLGASSRLVVVQCETTFYFYLLLKGLRFALTWEKYSFRQLAKSQLVASFNILFHFNSSLTRQQRVLLFLTPEARLSEVFFAHGQTDIECLARRLFPRSSPWNDLARVALFAQIVACLACQLWRDEWSSSESGLPVLVLMIILSATVFFNSYTCWQTGTYCACEERAA